MDKDKYLKLYDELVAVAHEIDPYYDIDKIKSYSVYIWTKGDFGDNVFDIMADEIVYYNKNHKIPKEAMPIIEKIQLKLQEIDYHCNARKVV